MSELLLAGELNDYFTFVKKVEKLGQEFEVYLDDYGQSFIIAWKSNNGKIETFCCGTYNDNYYSELSDIAFYEVMQKVEKGELLEENVLEQLTY